MKENADRARGLDPTEIGKQLRDGAEQMFRLKFQMSMGQMEGMKKYRSLRRERARMLTVLRERESGAEVHVHRTQTAAAPKPAAKPKAKPVVKAASVLKKPAPRKRAVVPKAVSKPLAAPKPRKSSKG
jgi:large subunit ribosomal protein L29